MGQVIDFEVEKAHRETLAKAKELVANPPKEEWGQLIPFQSDALPAFPTDTLPAWLGNYVRSLAESTQTPEDLAGSLVLAALAVIAAKRGEVFLKKDWKEPLNLYTVVTMESGSGKSPVFTRVFAPIVAWEGEVRERRRGDLEAAKQEREIMEKRRERAKREAAESNQKLERDRAQDEVLHLTKLLTDTPLPSEMELLANDITPEALASLMEVNGGRMAILDTEGGIFETFAGRYSDGVANIELFLKAHEGSNHKVRRQKGNPIFLKRPALTVALTVQPSVLEGLKKKDGFKGRGLLARFLYSLPPNLVGKRRWDLAREISQEVEACYLQRLRGLLSQYCAGNEETEVVTLCFEQAAMDRFNNLQIVTEERLGEGDLSGAKDWGGKFRGAVARLAGLLHIGDTLAIDSRSLIPLETLERAIRIGDYFLRHSAAAFGEMALGGMGEPCRRILEWIEKREAESFTQRELHKALDHAFPRAPLLQEPLKTLEERGYIREQEKPFVSIGRPSKVFEVNPSIFESIGTKGTKGTKPLNSLPPISKQRESAWDKTLLGEDKSPEKRDKSPFYPSDEGETVLEEGEI